MVTLRSRRLETLLGGPLEALTAEDVRGLVNTQAQEAFDLDFKKEHYGGTDSAKRKLASDVAAMANTAGGVILIGIDEDEQARATDAPGVELSDAERGRIRQVVAGLVSPMPTFDVEMIPDESKANPAEASDDANSQDGDRGRPAHGFMMIAVIRSPNAPHAVLVNNQDLRYPKRNGATTRYLSAPEVAAAHAEREASVRRQADRIAQVEQEAFRRIDRERSPWVVVTLVPDLPGDLAITTASFNDFRQKTMQTIPTIIPVNMSLHRVRVGRRRFLVDGGPENSPLAQYGSLELHADGAGAYGFQVFEYVGRPWLSDTSGTQPQLIDDEWIAVAVLSGLVRLAQHARDLTAASGNAVVRATLLPATTAESLEIGYIRQGPPESRSQISIRQDDLVAAEAVATLDSLAPPGAELIAVAAALTNEIGQSFGIAEMGQLSRDGAVRRHYFSHIQREILAWAERHHIEVTDDRLLQ